MKRLAVLVLSLLIAPISLADNVLVFGDRGERTILQTNLESLGHTVTNQAALPTDLSGFDTVWHVGAFVALTTDEQTRLTNFLTGGGGLHLTGERPCCESLNGSLQQLINSVVTSGGVQVGGLGDITGPYLINPAANSGLASNPNTVTTWVPGGPGGMGGLAGLPSPNVLVTGAGDVPVGATWVEADLVGAVGRLTILMDVNWFNNQTGDNVPFIENIQTFLAGGVVEPETGTARFRVTKTFTDLRTDEVDVTLTCNAGLPLQQNFTIAGGDPSGVTFTLTNVPDGGADCTVTESGGPDNYTAVMNGGSGCSWAGVTAGLQVCEIENQPDPGEYTVAMDWIIGEDGNEEDSYVVDIDVNCSANIIEVDDTPVTPAMQYSGTLDDGESVVLTIDTGAGSATCSATENFTQSGVEPSASEGCFDATIEAGGGADCLFTNTVFFEGIPTLNQYGLALLTLLMLGVGFVSVRRFA